MRNYLPPGTDFAIFRSSDSDAGCVSPFPPALASFEKAVSKDAAFSLPPYSTGTYRITMRLCPSGEMSLHKASEYHVRAEECRGLAARTAKPEHKSMLEGMAETWERLA